MSTAIVLRRASHQDHAILVEYNRRMAWETEHKQLDESVLSAGVAAALADQNKGFYLVAEAAGEVVGQLLVTREWSDWRNGWFWWIQSVYVHPEARRHGTFRSLFQRVEHLAKEAGDVVGLRLYVERENRPAQETYQKLGMNDASYAVFEVLIK